MAQENLGQSLRLLQKNSILKEKVYIHTNKTSYFQDDTIWFKAYVADTINHPSIQTTKLYVNLLDKEGIVIYTKKVLIEKGTGSGQFELNNAIPSGNYYIQAYTNYMRNFGNDHHYLQKIEVQDDNSAQPIPQIQNQYDIQILPEGGYLLENIENTVGIKALVNGLSYDFEGKLRNSSGESIASFKNQHSGMAKCKFLYRNDEKYTAEFILKDTVLTIEVPPAKRKGIALNLDNTKSNYLNVYLKTNEETLKNEDYSSYRLLFHQNQKVSDLISLTRIDSLSGLIQMKKDLFFDGVNTVTMFKGESPIAERKFFIEPKKQLDVQVKRLDSENDSITYKLVLRNRKKALESDLSISVLHADSQLHSEEQNIQTAFLLTAFLKGHVENPSYYFDQKNLKRLEHLDLLLLTQGWTQYSLPEMIAELNPKPLYKFEYGFDLKGKLDEAVKYDSIALIRDNFQIIEKVSLKDDYSFAFTNLLLYKEDTTKVAFIDTLGKVIKPKTIHYDSLEGQDIPRIEIPFGKKYSLSTRTPQQESNSPRVQIPKSLEGESTLTTLDRTIALEEAIVIEKKRSKQYLERRRIIEKYKPVVFDIGKYYDIPLPEVSNNSNIGLMDFLARQGFSVQTNNNGQSYLGGYRKVAPLFINGRPIRSYELPTLQLQIKDIENIMVNNLGFQPGAGVSIMIFQVFTSDAFNQSNNKLFDKFIIKNGFDRTKRYYAPLYAFEQTRPENLLEVDWKPSIKTNSKGEANFKVIKNHKNRRLLFSIQGFSEKGHLISETITVE